MTARPPDWLARTRDDGIGCYVHLPFCDRICPYCDFAVVRFREHLVARYLGALHAEMQLADDVKIQTLYLGGGTPSALPSATLDPLVRAIFQRFGVAPESVECTMEANPSRGIEQLAAYRAMGINRLSIGVQSFDEGELHRLGRMHDGPEAVAYFQAARAAGFDNLSIDLIAGAPGQDAAALERSLHQTIELAPDHVSVYGLTIEPTTPYATWQAREPQLFPDDDAQAALLELAEDLLTGAGMEHYEISNFAKPGFASAHNSGYWRQRDCVALGLSAAGYREGVRFANLRDMDAYCTALAMGRSPRAFQERLAAGARVGEAAMLALRTSPGLRFADFALRFEIDARTLFAQAIEKSKAAGLLEESADAIRLSRKGRLLANEACALFLEPGRSVA